MVLLYMKEFDSFFKTTCFNLHTQDVKSLFLSIK